MVLRIFSEFLYENEMYIQLCCYEYTINQCFNTRDLQPWSVQRQLIKNGKVDVIMDMPMIELAPLHVKDVSLNEEDDNEIAPLVGWKFKVAIGKHIICKNMRRFKVPIRITLKF